MKLCSFQPSRDCTASQLEHVNAALIAEQLAGLPARLQGFGKAGAGAAA
jgi:hypothetical protein